MSPEVWKAIPGHSDYEASSDGRVRRVTHGRGTKGLRVLKNHARSDGRLVVLIPDDAGVRRTMQVSRLVALAFHGTPTAPKDYACHNDGDHLNNRPENLRWDDQAGNMADRKKHGTVPVKRGSAAGGCAKLTDEAVAAIRASKQTCRSLGQIYGVHNSQISRIRNGRAW